MIEFFVFCGMVLVVCGISKLVLHLQYKKAVKDINSMVQGHIDYIESQMPEADS